MKLRTPYKLTLAALLLCLPSIHLIAQDDDWEARAARAMLGDFSPDGGGAAAAANSSANGGRRTAPTPPPAPAGPSPELVAAQQKLTTARENYQAELNRSQAEIQRLQSQLDRAKADKATYEANLASHKKDEDTVGTIARFFGQDRRASYLGDQIEDAGQRIQTLQGQLAAHSDALRTRSGQINRHIERLQNDVTRNEPTARAAENQRRTQELQALEIEYETQRAKITATRTVFREQVAMFDKVIEKAEEAGQDALAEQLRSDRGKIVTRGNEVIESLQDQLRDRREARHDTWAKNKADGLGPTNSGELRENLREQARAEGKDIGVINFVDGDVVRATTLSAQRISIGATRDTEHKNIFDNPTDADAWTDFAHDYSDGALTLFRDPKKFAERYGNYWYGVGEAGVDAVVDLAVLAKEVGDTAAEATEQAVNFYTGGDSNIFGTENLTTLGKASDEVVIFFEGGEAGRDQAQRAANLLDQGLNALDRRFSRQAATGEKGLREALRDGGYVVGTAVAIEEAAAGAVYKATVKGVRLWRGVDAVEDAATAANRALDASRPTTGSIPDVDPNATVIIEPPGGGRPVDPNGTVILDGPNGGAANAAEAGTVRLGPDGRPVSGDFAPPPTVGVQRGPNGENILTRSDGTQLVLGEKLGEGSTTAVYSVPGRDDIVIKITKAGGADVLDDAGYNVIKSLDPEGRFLEVPNRYQEYDINTGNIPGALDGDPLAGGRAAVVERAPTDFKKADGKVDIPKTPEGRRSLTPGQLDAYHKGLEVLNEQGFVFLDNKHDNFAFKQVGDDEWKLVIVDPGSIVPMTGRASDPVKAAENARALQRSLDTPSGAAVDNAWEVQGLAYGRAHHQEWLANQFDHLIDWDAIQRLTGKPYRTLGKGEGADDFYDVVFPFNPLNGRYYDNIARPETPVRLDWGDAANTAETATDAATGTTTGSRRVTVPVPNYGSRRAAVLTGKALRDEDEQAPPATSGVPDFSGGDGPPQVATGCDPGYWGGMDSSSCGDYGSSCDSGSWDAGSCGDTAATCGAGYWDADSGTCTGGGSSVSGSLISLGDNLTAVIDPIEFHIGSRDRQGEDPSYAAFREHFILTIKVLSVVNDQGNNFLNGIDPLIQNNTFLPIVSPPGGGGSGGSIPVLIFGSDHIPLSRFIVVSPPDACPEDHYHSVLPVLTCDGFLEPDPNPPECGYGPVSNIGFLPASLCANP